MLYKLGQTNGIFDSLEPVAFGNLPLEKQLEDLLAKSLLDVLFEEKELMPICQERSWQPEADIYALNKRGDLVIFELKREEVGGGAVHQALRYCEKAASTVSPIWNGCSKPTPREKCPICKRSTAIVSISNAH